MKGRKLLEGTLIGFSPDVVEAMNQALDWSWLALSDGFDDICSANRARETLANIIVGLAENGAANAGEIARQAIDLFRATEE